MKGAGAGAGRATTAVPSSPYTRGKRVATVVFRVLVHASCSAKCAAAHNSAGEKENEGW